MVALEEEKKLIQKLSGAMQIEIYSRLTAKGVFAA